MRSKPTRPTQAMHSELGGRLQQLVDAGDTRELARRSATLQAVMLDLHRQLAAAESQSDLARTMGLALTGSFACERLAVFRRLRAGKLFESMAEIGDVPAALHEEAPALAARLAPFLPHVGPLSPLQPPFSEAVAEPARKLGELGFVRAAWLQVEKQVEWVVLVGPKLSGVSYDEFDVALLRATFDAAALACVKLLLLDKLEERHRELMLANERLLQIDDLKSAILAGVSHELRTPLTRILSYTEALRAESVPQEESKRFLDIILGNTHRLVGRIDEALRFADLVGGRMAPERQQVPLHEVVETAVAAQATNARERGVRLEGRCQPTVAFTDANYVRMILKCLIDNALQFTPEGGEVCIDGGVQTTEAVLRVTDTGAGIDATARERIWRLFEPGDPSLQRERHGMGLGLALAQRMAIELGARLELEKTSAAGSTFSLHVPLSSARAVRAPIAGLRR